jgi:serine/threonine protein kinase
VSGFLSDNAMRRLQQAATWPDVTGTRYTLVRELGRGGMGTVYLAHDRELDRDVALKVVNASGRHAAFDARLKREATVLARLEHPGIVPVHDAGTLADGRSFYAMKLVRGEQLLDHLARIDRLDERLRVFERICEPVAFAHAQGVLHRDLKPSNVMVGGFGEVLVLDWGLSRVEGGDAAADEDADREADGASEAEPTPASVRKRDRLTEPGTIAGTPGFMAPEQRTGGSIDERSDVYSLGALLVTMLTGAAPEEGGTPAQLGTRGIDRRLRAICGRAMADRPEDRYAGAAALADDVARYRAGLPVAAYREGPLERAWRFAVVHRTAILLVLTYLLMRALVALYTSRGR